MDKRHLEAVPDQGKDDIVPYVVRMDVLNNPDLVGNELHWINEHDHVRYQQLTVIANELAGESMQSKEFFLRGVAVDNMMQRLSQKFNLDDEIAKVIPIDIDPTNQAEKQRKFSWWRKRLGTTAINASALTSRQEITGGGDAA